ncbi:hypothetical protein SLH46_11430 [Draconibacterium sp. IB214405]|uniref:hypothetical protein n=1 Tax=Draconibacterium sp. IB214405 TaxID=3097352 RepID=UPI002A1018BF|nr:hypothetical protein [Draconibacterium sp. IB214405]MDX8339799.1 hypothetical protein [Draconibacterium sp. IB214405]
MNRFLTISILFLFLISPFCGKAQNTVSPYSIFGPGEIRNGGFGANLGMGGSGIALESTNSLNALNPASYAGMDSLKLIFEFGLQGKGYNISNSNQSISGFEANLAYFALGFKYTPWMAGSFGMMPFSTVGYSINRTNYIEGTNEQYISQYVGSGGITRFYFANAIKLLKKLSLGVNTSYLFGPLIQEEYITGSTMVPSMMIERKDFLRSFYFDFGLQYQFISGRTDYSLGLTYAPEQSLSSKHIVTAYDSDYSTIQAQQYKTEYLVIPQIFGAGIGVTRERMSLAFDYTFQQWSNVDYPIQAEEFADSHRFSAGFEVNPWERRAINPGYKNWTYRMGFSHESSYLKFGNTTLGSNALTLGAGIPLYGAISNMDISLTGGTYGSTSGHLTKEKYLILNIGFSLNEMAFLKRVID